MGGRVQEWASQGSGQPNATYEKGVFYPYIAMLHNPNQTNPETAVYTDSQDWFGAADADFNIADLVYRASTNVDGSPYSLVTAFNPDTLIAESADAIGLMSDAVDDFDQETLMDAIVEACARVDDMMGESNIPQLAADFAARQDTAFNRDVGNLYAGLWEGSAIASTQTFVAAALMRNERNRETTEYERGLEVARQSQRTQLVGQLVAQAVAIATSKMQALQAVAGTRMDYLKLVALAKSDQTEKDLEYLTKDATWDLDLIQYVQNGLGAIYGAQQTPRAQTKGERLLAAVNSSISLGIQGGMALGNPAGGFALGAGNLLTQLLLTPR
jgi:hypothetical protein